MTLRWIDTHCHLDAPEFAPDVATVRAQAAAQGVSCCVMPAVSVGHAEAVRGLAHRLGDAYALGIHPLAVPQAADDDLARLDALLHRYRSDPRLVAVGEIGLDFFVPHLATEPLRSRQMHFYRQQLRLAKRHGLPVMVHVRRAVDAVLHGLREVGAHGGIAHAFNGSLQQAQALIALGMRLGFGGAFTHPRALRLRGLAAKLPLHSLVLETDAPDIPPHWLYVPAAQRTGAAGPRNTPAELPRIGAELAALRGLPVAALARASCANAVAALPGLAVLDKAAPPFAAAPRIIGA